MQSALSAGLLLVWGWIDLSCYFSWLAGSTVLIAERTEL